MSHAHCTVALLVASLGISVGCSAADTKSQTIKADVWADNWFAVYVGDELVQEDSVPFNTERSFNKDSFSFEATFPVQLNVIMRDFIEDDSGLEYIGTRRQQIGDGGFSAQFLNADTKEPVAVSDESWRCLAIHRGPLNRSCERSANPIAECQTEIIGEPDNWKEPDFDDSDWSNAVIHSAQEVRPRRGYDEVNWQPSAKLIWTEDLEIDNTILCRVTIRQPE